MVAPKSVPLLGALCLLSALAVHCAVVDRFNVIGRVYCDTCRFGFETNVTTYIPGAKVRVECTDRATAEVTYTSEAITDATGWYNITVVEDRPDEICECVLVSSPQADCKVFEKGRDRARVLLTHNNGITTTTRYANALGFIKDTALPVCELLATHYELNNLEE